MSWRELVLDANGVTLSHTKLWAHVAYLVGTIAFVRANWDETADWTIWAVYLGTVGASTAASKLFSLKHAGRDI